MSAKPLRSRTTTPSPLYSGERAGVRGRPAEGVERRTPNTEHRTSNIEGRKKDGRSSFDVRCSISKPPAGRPHTPAYRGEGARPAFTLIELLIVLGIVSVLLGLILPAAGNVRDQARSAACIANLRQLAQAAHAYATAGDGRYPIAYYTSITPTQVASYNWDFTLTRPRVSGSAWTIQPGLLWAGGGLLAGGGAMSVQQCPAYDGASNASSDPFTGYNYNVSYIGHGEHEAIPAPARISEVSNPSGCVLFGDGGYTAGANKFMRAPLANPGDSTFHGRWAGTQAFRHRGRTNVVFADQHAESLGERHTGAPADAPRVAEGTGFLSADNEMYDLK